MKRSDCLKSYQFFSGKASDIARQLDFAAIALIWVFRMESGGEKSLPQMLLCAALVVVLALTFDFFHYVYGSMAWGILHRTKEKQHLDEFRAPRWINWPSNAFFWGKTVATAAAYVLILSFLVARWF